MFSYFVPKPPKRSKTQRQAEQFLAAQRHGFIEKMLSKSKDQCD